jgi:putative transposase
LPRTARASEGGLCYHVLNRGNARSEVFHKPADYDAFLDAVAESGVRVPVRVLAYCLMPNHFHLVLWPVGDGDLSRFMHWLTTAHVRRYLTHYGHSGHVWQGRFKAFPVQDDGHLLTVLRYVERNPLRAGLVARAEEWAWSSLHPGQAQVRPRIDPGPIPRHRDWIERVNAAMTRAEEDAVRNAIRRGSPLGHEGWVQDTAERLDLGFTLRGRGRPTRRPK